MRLNNFMDLLRNNNNDFKYLKEHQCDTLVNALTNDVLRGINEDDKFNSLDDIDNITAEGLCMNIEEWLYNKSALLNYLSTLDGFDWATLSFKFKVSERIKGNTWSAYRNALYIVKNAISYLFTTGVINEDKRSILFDLVEYLRNTAISVEVESGEPKPIVSNAARDKVLSDSTFKEHGFPKIKKDMQLLKYFNTLLNDYLAPIAKASNSAVLIELFTELNKEMVKALEMAKDKTISYNAIISVNPLAFVYVSESDYLKSCYSWSRNGCYRGGTLGYMCDEVTAPVFFFKDSDDECCFTNRNFIFRKYLHLNTKRDAALFGRLYPQENDDNHTRAVAFEKAITMAVLPGYGYREHDDFIKNIYIDSKFKGVGYEDLNCSYCYDVCGASAKDWEHLGLSISTGYRFNYGATAYALDTGEELDDASKLVNENYCICEHCGRRVSEDCGRWIDDCFYCDDCCGCCDSCGEWHPVDELIETYNGDNVCRDCLDRYYAYCEDIDDYYPLDYCYYSEVDGCYYYDSDNAPRDDEDDESDGEDDEEREGIA